MRKLIAFFFILFPLFVFGSTSDVDPRFQADIEEILSSSQAILKEEKSLASFSEPTLKIQENCDSKNCLFDQKEESGLLVFISGSVSEATWREHSGFLECLGGRFIIRGLPGNAFIGLVTFLQKMRERGISAPVDLDSDLFAKYQVQSVPAIVLDNGTSYDIVYGNISIPKALELFTQRGESCELAKTLTHQLKQERAKEVLYAASR